MSDILSSANPRDFAREKRDFSRGGPFTPALVVTMLLYMVADAARRGYRHLLAAFWDEARSFGLELPTTAALSAPAFCKARHKITPGFMRVLLHQAADRFDAEFGAKHRWHGRRVFAIDGSKMNVRRDNGLAHAFGVPAGAHCPQILVSTLFDLNSKVPHDLSIARFASCERQELLGLLGRLRRGDVLVLDRGYPSFEILSTLKEAGIDFVIRVPKSHSFRSIDTFVQADGDDYRILIHPPEDGNFRDHPPIDVRAIRASGRNEPILLITSLRRAQFARSAITDLYRQRWEIEEFYKLLKSNYLGQEQFHSLSADGVRQEVLALALFVTITRYLMAAAVEAEDTSYDDLSPKAGVLGLAAYILRLALVRDPAIAAQYLDQLLIRIARTRDPKRKGRSYPRRSFRPTRKWGPGGRRGG